MLTAFSVVLLFCIFTARSKAGVAGGIGAFVALRIVLWLLLYVARRFQIRLGLFTGKDEEPLVDEPTSMLSGCFFSRVQRNQMHRDSGSTSCPGFSKILPSGFYLSIRGQP
jgi:hypothetical protein